MASGRGTELACPSAQPGMAEVQVLGVVARSSEGPRVAYLNGHLPASDELLAETRPLPPTQVLRLAGRCQEQKCVHFDGRLCQLASRIVSRLDAVVDALPACVIRKTCRWFEQEGQAACFRCPQIVTSATDEDGGVAGIAYGADGVDARREKAGDRPPAADASG